MSMLLLPHFSFFFFFNDTATTEIYTLSLPDSLPISLRRGRHARELPRRGRRSGACRELREGMLPWPGDRREDALPRDRKSNTSELQSRQYLVCRLLLEKKKYIYQPQVPFAA